MQIILVNIFEHMGSGVEIDLINAFSVVVIIVKSINEVKLHSKTHMFENIYPDFIRAL